MSSLPCAREGVPGLCLAALPGAVWQWRWAGRADVRWGYGRWVSKQTMVLPCFAQQGDLPSSPAPAVLVPGSDLKGQPQGPQRPGWPMVTPSISSEVSQELGNVSFSSSFRPSGFPNGYSCSGNIKVICSKPTDTETFCLPHFSSCLRGGQANTSSPGLQAASQP